MSGRSPPVSPDLSESILFHTQSDPAQSFRSTRENPSSQGSPAKRNTRPSSQGSPPKRNTSGRLPQVVGRGGEDRWGQHDDDFAEQRGRRPPGINTASLPDPGRTGLLYMERPGTDDGRGSGSGSASEGRVTWHEQYPPDDRKDQHLRSDSDNLQTFSKDESDLSRDSRTLVFDETQLEGAVVDPDVSASDHLLFDRAPGYMSTPEAMSPSQSLGLTPLGKSDTEGEGRVDRLSSRELVCGPDRHVICGDAELVGRGGRGQAVSLGRAGAGWDLSTSWGGT